MYEKQIILTHDMVLGDTTFYHNGTDAELRFVCYSEAQLESWFMWKS